MFVLKRDVERADGRGALGLLELLNPVYIVGGSLLASAGFPAPGFPNCVVAQSGMAVSVGVAVAGVEDADFVVQRSHPSYPFNGQVTIREVPVQFFCPMESPFQNQFILLSWI